MSALNIPTSNQLNRLVSSQSFHNLDSAANAFESSGAVANMYANRFTYDANGNIESQVRADEAGTEFDRLTYRYYDVAGERVHNRLYHVNDSASSSLAADDIDDMGAFSGDTLAANINLANNYGYDAIGQLIRDEQEGIDSIIWRADGKIKEIIRSAPATGSHLRFMYDPLGNRLAKIELNTQGQEARSTWYQRDAQGNPLSVYTREVDYQAQTATFAQTEKIIYGSQRLGMRVDTVEVQSATMPGLERPFIAGNTRYELTNHLGNVLTTISGKRLAHGPDSGTATHYTTPVLSASDYSPFGAPLHGRTWSGGYRYGFTGLERDDEVAGSGDHYGFGDYGYSPRLGRRWNVDPKFNEIAGLSPYTYSLNNPIVYKDPDGELPILPLLLKAGAAGAADMLAQAAMAYYFDPKVESVGQAFEVVNYWQVSRSAAEGLIPWRTPGGRIGKAAATASGDVLVNAIHAGSDYTQAQALQDFATGFIGDLAGGGLGDLVAKYGSKGVANGLLKMGFDTKYIRKATGGLDNKEVRSWYSEQVKGINIDLDPTEANARMVVGQRNTLKQQARDLMSDRKAAADLDISDPIRDFDYYNNKYDGDYSKIMQGGTKPNADVNKKLGVD